MPRAASRERRPGPSLRAGEGGDEDSVVFEPIVCRSARNDQRDPSRSAFMLKWSLILRGKKGAIRLERFPAGA